MAAATDLSAWRTHAVTEQPALSSATDRRDAESSAERIVARCLSGKRVSFVICLWPATPEQTYIPRIQFG